MKTKLRRHYFTLVTLCFNVITSYSQSNLNLVPNPSFEMVQGNLSNCFNGGCGPIGESLSRADDWDSYSYSSDLFFPLAGNCFPEYLPSTPPYHGDLFAGIQAFYPLSTPNVNFPNIYTTTREFAGTELSCPTLVGVPYKVSGFFRRGDQKRFAIDKLGFRFDKNPTLASGGQCGPGVTDIAPAHIASSDIIYDSWTEVSGVFVADDTYSHLLIGVFDEHSTVNYDEDTSILTPSYAYYHIDQVAVEPLAAWIQGTDYNSEITINAGDTVTLSAYGSGPYNWSASTGESVPNVQSPNVSPTQTTIYEVTVDLGCTVVTTQITVNVNSVSISCSQNLVPNPSFEDRTGCASGTSLGPPFNVDIFDNVDNWYSPTAGTADAMSTCNGKVPSYFFYSGDNNVTHFYQNPVHGDGIAAIYVNAPTLLSSEYIQVELTAPLTAGTTYQLEFYTSLAETSQIGSQIGGYLTNTAFEDYSTGGVLNATPQVTSGIITDKDNWTLVSGSFTANGGERFLTLGSFSGNAGWTDLGVVPLNDNYAAYMLIDQVAIFEFNDPIPIAGANQTFCSGSSAQLNASLSNGINYSWTPTTGLSNPSIPNPVASPSGTTTYTVSVDYGGGCIKQDQVTLTQVNCDCSLLNYTDDIIDADCHGGEGLMRLSGTDPSPNTSLYVEWRNQATNQIVNPNNFSRLQPALAGTYTAFIRDEYTGCTQTINDIVVGEPPLYEVNVININPATCAGDDGSVEVSVTGGTPQSVNSVQYRIKIGSGSYVSMFSNTITLGNLTAGTYPIEVLDGNNCILNTTVTVTTDCSGCTATVDAGPDLNLCRNDFAVIPVTVSGGTPVSVSWSPTYGLDDPTVLNPTFGVNFNVGPTPYTVTVDFGGGCVYSDYLIINNKAEFCNPGCTEVVDAGPNQTINSGDTTNLNAAPSSGAPSYTWTASPADASISGQENTQNPTVSPTQTTTYTLTADFGGGCIDTDTVIITINTGVCTETVDAGPDQTINSGDTTNLNTTPTGGTPTYTWTASPADTSLSGQENTQNPSVSPTQTTTYTVTADFGGGCIETDDVMISVNPINNFCSDPINTLSNDPGENWYFGNGAGLSFASNPPSPLTGSNQGALISSESCTSISDDNGNLLFYSNGINVWNRNHVIMQNGNGLLGNVSTTQTVIAKSPANNNNYFLFYSRANDPVPGFPLALYYAKIDMNQNGGLGAVISKNNLLSNNPSELMAVTPHANGTDLWFLTYEDNATRFNAYQIESSGTVLPAVVSTVSYINTSTPVAGQIKFSPVTNEFASVFFSGTLGIYGFDPCSGNVSNKFIIPNSAGFGLEYSSDGSKIYISTGLSPLAVQQFDLSSENLSTIEASRTLIFQNNETSGVLERGIDGKIYHAVLNSSFLSVINNPNESGLNCDYQFNAISLGGNTSTQGLPTFQSSIKTNYDGAANAGPDQTNVCTSSTVQLDASLSNGSSYVWSGLNGAPDPDDTAMPQLTGMTPGIYTFQVEVTYAGGCVSIDCVAIEIVNCACPETIDAGPDQTINTGDTANLNATPSGGTPTYTWTAVPADPSLSGQENDQDPTVSPAQTTVYTVTADFGGGCSATDTVTVTVNTPGCTETVDAGTDVTIIQGNATQLTATPSSVTVIYTWIASPTDGSLTGQQNNQNPNVSPTQTTTYTVIADFGGGCSATDNVTVTVNTGTVCSVSLNTSSVNLNDADCGTSNGSITGITITGSSSGATYSWTDGSGTQVGTTLNLTDIGQGSYTLTVIDGSCNDIVGPFDIMEESGPVLDSSNVVVNDADCGTTNGSITGITITGSSSGAAYSWTDGSGTQVGTMVNLTGIGQGSYTLTVSDGSCSDVLGPFDVIEGSDPVLNGTGVVVTDTDCGASNGSITGITVSGNSGSEVYSWTDASGIVVGDTINLTDIGDGSYTLTVTDGNCSDTLGPFAIAKNSCLGLLKIANTMTPNGDGSNDMFMIQGIENYPNSKLHIFNRWGNKLYEATGYSNDWYGTFNGKGLPVANYYYVLRLNDTEQTTFRGYITIIR